MSEEEKEEEKSLEEYGREVYVASTTLIREAAPKLVLNIGVAILIWLFGNLVFIPISEGIFIRQYVVARIIGLITLAALVGLVLAIVYELRRMADAAAGILAYEVGRRGEVSVDEVSHYRTAIIGILYVVLVSMVFLLFSKNLSMIHPALTGIALIAVVIWAFFTLWRVGRALSAEITRYAAEWTERLRARVAQG